MKLPVQKTERRKEPMRSELAPWMEPRALMEKFFPESWVKPWFDWEKGFYRDMESWMPRVDVSETDKEYQIAADVPGVKPEDIKVEVTGDTLILSGKSEEEKEESGKTWHRVERKSGSFYREFELPKWADTDQVEASTRNGTLMVRLPKKPEAQSKTIEVKPEEKSQPGQPQEPGEKSRQENKQGNNY